MSFSYDTKNELCRLPVQKLCCARAAKWGFSVMMRTSVALKVLQNSKIP